MTFCLDYSLTFPWHVGILYNSPPPLPPQLIIKFRDSSAINWRILWFHQIHDFSSRFWQKFFLIFFFQQLIDLLLQYFPTTDRWIFRFCPSHTLKNFTDFLSYDRLTYFVIFFPATIGRISWFICRDWKQQPCENTLTLFSFQRIFSCLACVNVVKPNYAIDNFSVRCSVLSPSIFIEALLSVKLLCFVHSVPRHMTSWFEFPPFCCSGKGDCVFCAN